MNKDLFRSLLAYKSIMAQARQYSGNRNTMPDDVESLCDLFEREIEQLNRQDKRKLLIEIQEILNIEYEDVNGEKIGQYICSLCRHFYGLLSVPSADGKQ